jgi:large subunit ribosomal protein L32e
MTEQKAMPSKRALRLRKQAKAKKPNFVRQESWKYIRLKENWRRPHGLDNKVRKRFKGWPARVSAGYRGPKSSRNLHPSGFEEVIVFNVEDLRGIKPETQAARIAHTVGRRKRAQILVEARKKEITILNQREKKETPKEGEEAEKEGEEEEAETEDAKQQETKEDKATKKRTDKK